LKGTLFLFYAEDFDLLGENIHPVKKGRKHLSAASPEFGTEMHRKLGTMFATREQKNHNIKQLIYPLNVRQNSNIRYRHQ
jgi:hypothetical protein